jgi:membrane fusion protein (multidrug efflux system)
MRRILIATLIVGALAAAIVWRLRHRPVPATTARLPPEVLVAPPVRCDVAETLDFPVDVDPIEQASLASKQPGYLSQVLVDRGDHVHRGELLAVVEPADLADVAGQARAQVTQAQAQVALAEQNEQRGRTLYGQQMISQQDYDQLASALTAAQANLQALQDAEQAASVRVSQTALTAPFDGYVTDRLADPGALLTGAPTAAPILTVARLDPVRVMLHVPEEQIARVQLHQPVTLEVSGMPGQHFYGRVERLSPSLDPATRTEAVEAQLPNPGDPPPLRAGMFGRANLQVGQVPGGLVVPSGAVLLDGSEHWVYVARQDPTLGDIAARVDVTIGVDGGDSLEIRSGLQPDDQIIVRGVDLVGDKAAIRPVAQAANATPTPSLCVPPASAPASGPVSTPAVADPPAGAATGQANSPR